MTGYKGNCWPNESQMLLLQAALCEYDIAINAWEKWATQVDINLIDPISYQMMPKIYRNLSKVSIDFSHHHVIKGIYMHTWMNNQLVFNAFADTMKNWPLLNSQRIVLLKGAAMIAGYYKDLGVRVIGDFDILVPKQSINPLMNYLFDRGFKLSIPLGAGQSLDTNWADAKHAVSVILPNSLPSLNIDVHATPVAEICLTYPTTPDWFEHSVPANVNGLDIHRLDATDLLFQTCVHGTKYSEVPLIRWIVDATTLLEKGANEIDWDKLKWNSREYELVLPIRNALNYLSEHFTRNIPNTILNDINRLPVSRFNRFEFKYNAKKMGGLFKTFAFLWFQSRRQKKSFIQYLKEFWGLNSVFQVPLKVCTKSVSFLIRSRSTND